MNAKKSTLSKDKANKKNKNAVVQRNPLLDKFETQTLWHIALLVLLPFFLYIKTVNYLLINFDDVQIIVNNLDFLSSIKNIGLAFKTDAFISLHGDYYRPLQTVSLMFDTIFGGGKPWLYHFFNLIYHILTVVSLYYLFRLLNIKTLSALFAALVFSVHPLLSSAVSWIPARGDILIGLFGVLTFISFIKYTNTRKPLFLILSVLSFALAVFSKETALLLPLILLFYYFILAKNEFKLSGLKSLLPFFVLWLIVFVVFYILRSKVVVQTPPDFIFGIKPFLNNLPVIPILLFKFIVPAQLSTMPLFQPVITILGMFVLLFAIWLSVRAFKQKQWLIILGIGWFLLFAIPPMFFKLFFSKYLLEYYQHRAYLPYMGLSLVLAFLIGNIKNRSILNIVFSIAILFVFTLLALSHSDSYKDSLAFFSNAAERQNPGACTKRGEYYMGERDFGNAIVDFNSAIEMSKGEYAPAFYNRAMYSSQVTKDHNAAEQDLSKTIEIDSTFIDAYIQRASERVFSNNFDGALADLDKAATFDPTRVDIYYNKAKVLTSAMKFNDALPFYNKSISMYEYSPEMYNDRAYVRYRVKDYNGALKDCNKAIRLMPNFMSAYYNKGIIYLEMGQPKIAIKELDTTLALTNNFYFGYFYRGMAKKQMHDMKGACADWQESVRLGFTMAQDTINRYCK